MHLSLKSIIVPLFLVLITSACGQKNQASTLRSTLSSIIGGEEAKSDDFRSTLEIIDVFGAKCSGTLIDDQHILTAAHCVIPYENIEKDEKSQIITEAAVNALKTLAEDAKQEEKIEVAQKAMRKSFDFLASKYFIHLDDGRVLMDQVEKAIFSASSLEMNINLYLKRLELLPPEKAREIKHNSLYDMVILKLKNPISDIPLTPLISKEALDAVGEENPITLVGYGLLVTGEVIASLERNLEMLVDQINSMPEDEDDSELREKFNKANQEYIELYEKYQRPPAKMKVNLKINKLDGGIIELLHVKRNTGQGACMGDSGSGAYVETAEGNVIQMGIITSGICGKFTYVTPINQQEIQNIIDLNL